MKIEASISFRKSADLIVPLLPSEFKFLANYLQDISSSVHDKPTAYCIVPVDQMLVQHIIQWGRQSSEGFSLIRGITVDEQYELADLEGLNIVEVYTRFEDFEEDENDILHNYGGISNYRKVFKAIWQCSCCGRMSIKQIGDLAVELYPEIDVQNTMNSDWVVSKKALQVFDKYGVEWRRLDNTSDYVQLNVSHECHLRTDTPPVKVSTPCPCCTRYVYTWRDDTIEGSNLLIENTNITVRTTSPLTIDLTASSMPDLAWADIDFAGYAHSETHKAGTNVNLEPRHLNRSRVLFASAELVGELLKVGVNGLAFRPVNIHTGEM